MNSGSVAVLACVLAILVAPASFADPNPSQRMDAECTLQSRLDITQRARFLLLTAKLPRERAWKRARDELLNEDILQHLTQLAGIRISNQQVDEAYASIAERVKLTPKHLSEALRQSGVEPKTLKVRLLAVIGRWQLVMFMQDGTGGTLTNKQVDRILQQKLNEFRAKRHEDIEGAYWDCR